MRKTRIKATAIFQSLMYLSAFMLFAVGLVIPALFIQSPGSIFDVGILPLAMYKIAFAVMIGSAIVSVCICTDEERKRAEELVGMWSTKTLAITGLVVTAALIIINIVDICWNGVSFALFLVAVPMYLKGFIYIPGTILSLIFEAFNTDPEDDIEEVIEEIEEKHPSIRKLMDRPKEADIQEEAEY